MIDAMKQALEAFNQIDMAGIRYNEKPVECVGRLRAIAIDAATGLRQAIEQAEKQEPVAWMWLQNGNPVNAFVMKPQIDEKYWEERGFTNAPLYTAPPRKEWVGLTDFEINKITNSPQPVDETSSGYVLPFAKAIQAKLKEKNGAL
jgi:hypothetical protein